MSWLNKWWVLCAMALLVGIIIGWASPPPPLPKQTAISDIWQLDEIPHPSRKLSSELNEQIAAVKWDGETSEQGPQGPWRLAGVASGPVALIEMQNSKEVLRLTPGEVMPDESTLLNIMNDRIEVEQKGCILVYQLYNLKPIDSRGEGCPEQTPSDTESAAPAAQ